MPPNPRSQHAITVVRVMLRALLRGGLRTVALLALPSTMLLAACAPSATCQLSGHPLPLPELTVVNGVLYSVAQHLDAWDAATGTLFWQARQAPRPGVRLSVPLVAGGVVYMATEDGTVLAWKATTGAALWQSRPLPGHTPVVDGIVPPPTVVGSVVYAGAGDGLAAWRARDGALLWQSPALVALPPTASAALPNLPVPIVASGAVYVATANVVTALRARDGRRLWQAHAPLASQRFSTPVIAGSTLYVGTSNDTVYAFAAQSGALLWQSPPIGIPSTATGTDAAAEVLVAGTRVYLSTQDGWVAALRTADGALVWQTQIPGAGAYRPAQLAGTLLYTASAAGVYALDGAHGQIVWQAGANLGTQPSPLIVADDMVYASGPDTLYAWHALDGVFQWQILLAHATPLAAAEGLVFLGRAGATPTCRLAGTASAVAVLWSGDGTVVWQTAV